MSSQAKDIRDFLAARIEEDRLYATAAASSSPGWGAYFTTSLEHGDFSEAATDSYRDVKDGDGDYVVEANDHAPTQSQAEHIARWDPERVLAECNAKKGVVERHYVSSDTRSRFEFECLECQQEFPCQTLRLLALPYADHEEYRAGWRP